MRLNKKKIFYNFIQIFQKNNTTSRFIWDTILIQKRNLFLNIISGIFNAITEGLSLGFVFLLAKVITYTTSENYDWEYFNLS